MVGEGHEGGKITGNGSGSQVRDVHRMQSVDRASLQAAMRASRSATPIPFSQWNCETVRSSMTAGPLILDIHDPTWALSALQMASCSRGLADRTCTPGL